MDKNCANSKCKIELKHLPLKAVETYVVRRTKGDKIDEWFFDPKNGSVFEPPYERACRPYDKLKNKEMM